MVDEAVGEQLLRRWPLLKVLHQTDTNEVVEALGPLGRVLDGGRTVPARKHRRKHTLGEVSILRCNTKLGSYSMRPEMMLLTVLKIWERAVVRPNLTTSPHGMSFIKTTQLQLHATTTS